MAANHSELVNDIYLYRFLALHNFRSKFLIFVTKNYFTKGRFGHTSEIYTTYVHGRPFVFESVGKKLTLPATGMGIWAMKEAADKDWRDIIIVESE